MNNYLKQNKLNIPSNFKVIQFSLGTVKTRAQAEKVSWPFDQIFVSDCDIVLGNIFAILYSNGIEQDTITLSQGKIYNFDSTVNEVSFFWDAQTYNAGDGQQTNVLMSLVISQGIKFSNNSNELLPRRVQHINKITVTSSAVSIAPVNLKRVKLKIFNQGPNTVYLGNGSGFTYDFGFPLLINTSYDHDSHASLSAQCVVAETALLKFIEYV